MFLKIAPIKRKSHHVSLSQSQHFQYPSNQPPSGHMKMFSGVVVWMEIMDNGRGLFAKIPVYMQTRPQSSYLSDAQSVGNNAVHGVGVHLGPLQLEAVDSGPVLPQGAVGVVVELRRVGLSWRESRLNTYCTSTELRHFVAVSVRLYSQASKTLIISFHSFLQSHVSTVTSSYVTSSGLFVPWLLMMLNGAFCDVTCHKNLSDANPTNLADVGPWRLFINALLTHLLFLQVHRYRPGCNLCLSYSKISICSIICKS